MKIMLAIDILQSTCMEKLRCRPNERICNKINELLYLKHFLYTIVTY